jgi:hypothetical protein
LATRKFSLSHLIAVVRTGNGELVEDVVHRHAIEEDGGTAHGTVVDAGPTRPTRTRDAASFLRKRNGDRTVYAARGRVVDMVTSGTASTPHRMPMRWRWK